MANTTTASKFSFGSAAFRRRRIHGCSCSSNDTLVVDNCSVNRNLCQIPLDGTWEVILVAYFATPLYEAQGVIKLTSLSARIIQTCGRNVSLELDRLGVGPAHSIWPEFDLVHAIELKWSRVPLEVGMKRAALNQSDYSTAKDQYVDYCGRHPC
jgi:hypothetical protein